MKTIYKLLLLSVLGIFQACSEDTIGEELTGSVTGLVIAKATGEPIPEAEITTSPASTTVFTDENGEFKLENILVDSYSVKAEADGYVTSFKGVAVTTGATSNVVIEMAEGTGNNRAPNPPKLITPEDNAEGQSLELDLIWEASDPDADSLTYELEIRNNRNDDILKYENIQDTIYRLEGLNYGYKYFWQVKVSDSINNPVMSEVKSFTTLEHPESRIFYVKSVNGNNVIYAMDPNENEYQLTSSEVNSFRPRKNLRTNKIAYLKTEANQTHLYTMNLDGSQQTRVTGNIPVNGFNLEQLDFSWADDGASLVYPNFSKLYKVNVNGNDTELIYQEPKGKFITEVDVSEKNGNMALLVNNASGYEAEIYMIDPQGNKVKTVLSNVDGAVGGLDISVDNKLLLFTRDISGYESSDYRRLNSRIFIYNLETSEVQDYSRGKLEGTNDLDPRFSPNEAEIIFVNTSNDGVSQNDIYTAYLEDQDTDGSHRYQIIEDAKMPDWE
ncbi:MAG TPA: carboxypeptidase regulatory-like domain-containing protein [Salegentibacter sp.]|uniref:carboxypeptidase regulatory-like domain-containing protein n=1 Tax=Salegentibacter sp. TaxID=1903072 RepID=UPI002F94E8D8